MKTYEELIYIGLNVYASYWRNHNVSFEYRMETTKRKYDSVNTSIYVSVNKGSWFKIVSQMGKTKEDTFEKIVLTFMNAGAAKIYQSIVKARREQKFSPEEVFGALQYPLLPSDCFKKDEDPKDIQQG